MNTNGKKIIFIADDTPVNLEILIELLSDEYIVRVATDGESALKHIRNAQPDLILLDIMMPGMDGFEVCQRLKADTGTRKIPVVFLTALSDSCDEGRGLSLGASDFITKPFSPDLVRLRVRTQLELKSYREDMESVVRGRTAALEEERAAAIAGMAILSEYPSGDTGQHIRRVREYFRYVADALHARNPTLIRLEDIDGLAEISTLHDIGKVAVPDSILFKPGTLSPEEFEVIKTHTTEGVKVIEFIEASLGCGPFLARSKEMIEFHHEKFDGSGYPCGLSGVSIPVSAQIMAIVDIYDALVSFKIYKPPMDHDRAVAIIRGGDGRVEPSHFDPRVLEAFLDAGERIRSANFGLSQC
jgi:putative two-component system response regulator